MALQYFCLIKSKEFGPMSGSELTALAKMGKLSATDMVRQENSGRWLPAGRFNNLKFGTVLPSQEEKEEVIEVQEEEKEEAEEVPKEVKVKSMKSNNQKRQAADLVDTWGNASRAICVISGGIAIIGGVNLVMLKSAGENSMIEAIANGMGLYFIAKGTFMMAIPFQVRGAVAHLFSK
jgi:hypothetical protein